MVDKPTKPKYVSVRFPPDVKKALELYSVEKDMSQESIVVSFTRQGLVDEGFLETSGRAKRRK